MSAVTLIAIYFTSRESRTSMAGYSCRLCRAVVLPKYAVGIFRPTAAKQRLLARIEDLLGVKVLQNDGLPQHICQKYKHRLETLERATEDLQEFRTIAMKS